MFNISLNVLLFHHFNVDQDVQQFYCYHGKKPINKTKQKQNLLQLWRFKSVPIFSFWIYIIFISFSLWRQNLREKNNTSCKTCLVINLEIKIIQFPLTPVPISPCIFPCTVLFVESASSHRSARSLETLFFFGCNMSARLERLTMRKIIMRRNGWNCTLRIRVDSLIYRRLSKSRLLCT